MGGGVARRHQSGSDVAAAAGGVVAAGWPESIDVVVFFVRHGLSEDFVGELAPLQFHVYGAFAADGTFVCDCHEISVAFSVHVVSAW